MYTFCSFARQGTSRLHVDANACVPLVLARSCQFLSDVRLLRLSLFVLHFSGPLLVFVVFCSWLYLHLEVALRLIAPTFFPCFFCNCTPPLHLFNSLVTAQLVRSHLFFARSSCYGPVLSSCFLCFAVCNRVWLHAVVHACFAFKNSLFTPAFRCESLPSVCP